jgi:hypothetical protein
LDRLGGISKRLRIASSTASESVTGGRQILKEQGLKLLMVIVELAGKILE